ncbi:hypothetical protein SAMN02927900_02839 [Rhizobium mongolense subsp. loessense]|uniref:Uncharacterized protein n=1 Tax=Rhizobium mongolense subsp. loessense TaxID=158890 RepID=A0A1G4RL38_9HYPH|nr:hypothetical protein [Rhizobium mongolense]SCW57652.1 hypothetical protein SAMN02927900_02839 [Rhizobium mongolense subsp. loessense]
MSRRGLARIDPLGAGQTIQRLKIGSAQRFLGPYAGEDIGAERAVKKPLSCNNNAEPATMAAARMTGDVRREVSIISCLLLNRSRSIEKECAPRLPFTTEHVFDTNCQQIEDD